MQESRVITQSINQAANDLYERFWKPEAFAEWASGLTTSGLQQDDKGWKFQGPAGDCRMTFTEHNKFGIMDHWVHIGDKQIVYAPMRIVPNGDGCDVQITWFRQPGMDDTTYESNAKQIMKDLEALKKLVEGS